MTEDTDACYTPVINGFGGAVQQNYNDAEFNKFGEAKQKYKALCYKDICL
jgi:hypothetical protein